MADLPVHCRHRVVDIGLSYQPVTMSCEQVRKRSIGLVSTKEPGDEPTFGIKQPKCATNRHIITCLDRRLIGFNRLELAWPADIGEDVFITNDGEVGIDRK